jgi:uncharacterized protein
MATNNDLNPLGCGTHCGCALVIAFALYDAPPIRDSTSLSDSLVARIEAYQQHTSPALHEQLGVDRICGYEPSCSEYARQAITEYGTVKGGLKAAARIARCNPLSKGGYDPA